MYVLEGKSGLKSKVTSDMTAFLKGVRRGLLRDLFVLFEEGGTGPMNTQAICAKGTRAFGGQKCSSSPTKVRYFGDAVWMVLPLSSAVKAFLQTSFSTSWHNINEVFYSERLTLPSPSYCGVVRCDLPLPCC